MVSAQDNVSVRPLEAADEEPVRTLLQDLWAHDPLMLTVYSLHRVWPPSEPPVRQTLVVTVGGHVRGVGTLVETTLHPKLLWAAINVSPDWQRRGLGSSLYGALEAVGDGRPWMVKLTLRDRAGTSFLAERGFYNPRGRGVMGVLDPQTKKVKGWLEGLPREVPGYHFLSLDDPDNPATLEDAARVHAAVYRQYHTWNPPVEESTERALAHYCGPNVFSGSHLCVFEDDRLIGAANLFRYPPESEEAYLAHVGVVGKARPQVQALTAALIRRSLEWASSTGLKVRFEADEEYAPHRALYETAPADEVDRDFAIFINA